MSHEMRNSLPIESVMRSMPPTVHAGAPISEVRKILARDGIRYLPVLERGELVGAIGARELEIAETFHATGYLTVGEAMRSPAYAVDPSTPLTEVLRQMMDRRVGSAFVVSPRGIVIGIFTRGDALEMLNGLILLEERGREEIEEWKGTAEKEPLAA